MRVVHQKDPPLRQGEGCVLAVVVHAVRGLLRESVQVKQVTCIVAVNQVDRQSQSDDRVQRGGRNQVAAVQYRLRTERFCLRDCRGERFAMVVAVGDDADFQIPPPRAL
jgi:hypothetical protein